MRTKAIVMGIFSLWISSVGAADAGQVTDLQLYDGTSHSPKVTVHYTNANGNGHESAPIRVDPQVSGGAASPLYYCIDLWHDNLPGATYTVTPVSTISYAKTSTFSDVDNRLAWLVNQAQDTVDERAAVQLALWYTVDNKGFFFSGGDRELKGDYNSLISFAGYDPSVNYTAQLWAATHGAHNTLYQDLISAVPGSSTNGDPTPTPTPEPGSLVLAGVSMASALGWYAIRRRRQMTSAA